MSQTTTAKPPLSPWRPPQWSKLCALPQLFIAV